MLSEKTAGKLTPANIAEEKLNVNKKRQGKNFFHDTNNTIGLLKFCIF
jgi:hypothetical protein